MPTLVTPAITERIIVWHQPRAVATTFTGAGTYICQPTGGMGTGSTGNLNSLMLFIDPSSYNPRPTKMRMLTSIISNDTAAGTSFTFGLYPVGTPSGGVGVLNPNVGAVVAGSTILYTTPAANLTGNVETSSGDFAIPAVGSYVLACAAAGAMAANSMILWSLRLEWRFV